MTPTDPCPPAADFEAFLRGRLDDARSDAVERHVERCARCQRTIDGLTVDTRLTDALRGDDDQVRGPSDPVADPRVGAMVARIEEMASQFTPAGFDLHPSAPGSVGECPPFDPPHAPEDLGRMSGYRVVRLLGGGGMGLVYLAEDEALRRPVAVKILRPRLARHSRARDGFLREARAVAALKHDNVVTVFQVGEAVGPDGTSVPFLAMELLEGESLADWLRRGERIPAGWAARLGRQAAEGLAAAHARGVVHRDIKPGNLWLEVPAGWDDLPPDARPPLPAVARVKVLDFGLAQPAGIGDRASAAFGTPAYMPPEQAAGQEVDHRADLFSLGVVLYELVVGRLPFARTESDERSYATPEPVERLAPDVPPALADLIGRLLSPAPADRPTTARQVAAELLALTTEGAGTDGRGLPARRPLRRVALVVGLAAFGVLLAGMWLAGNKFRQSGGQVESGPLTRPGPPDDEWVAAVTALPVDRQPGAVIDKLCEFNPGYDGQVAKLGFENGMVTEFAIKTDDVSDIRPLRALTGLKSLYVTGSAPGLGRLADLSPVRGLPLTVLNIWQNPALTDLSATRGMQLTVMQAGDTAVADLSPLEGMPLSILAVNNCRVRDVSPVRTLAKVRLFRCDGCPIDTLEPLAGSKVRELICDFRPTRGDAAILARMPQLESINRLTTADFLRRHAAAR
ncbi:protein kinase [Gemmata sp. JC717]|uniref:protein kinase domain-containing protein n=1 Tax=Gemmata algarum TaxID=2975278 RepID=UPI0021BA47CB|nr:protein kinase [Gemmata algarum]MDY3555456.1 protein kinase [Gemmata algarum]